MRKPFAISSVFFVLSFCLHYVHAGSINYVIQASIDPGQQSLMAQVNITSEQRLSVDVSKLNSVSLNGQAIQSDDLAAVTLAAGKTHQINYQLSLNSYSAYSDKDNVVLSGSWYPVINKLAHYQLTVQLPGEFKALSEANEIESQPLANELIEYRFKFPHALDRLTLVASKNYQQKMINYKGIQIETWFTVANAHLMDNYLEHAKNYLALYEDMLGAYPYQRFAMVESPLPSGQSMPSYTLLGSRVIALPFIVKTSLGHEILHQWFGSSVYVDYQYGNWCEGITNYLADYYYQEQQGKGIEYRKGMLRQYSAYVNDKNVFPVRKFISRTDKKSSAIGYSRVAMIFHQLRQHYGDDDFFTALRAFIQNNQFHKASWHDIQKEFEAIDNQPMYEDFQAWLTRTDLAKITIGSPAQLEVAHGKLWLIFSLKQAEPHHLHLPLRLNYENEGNETRYIHLTAKEQFYRLEIPEPPVSVSLDPDYHLMRQLADREKIPDLAWLMSRQSLLLVVSKEQEALYQTLFSKLGNIQIRTVTPENVRFDDLKSHSLILAGSNNMVSDMLFAVNAESQKNTETPADVDLIIKRNPYNDQQVVALANVRHDSNLKTVARKLRHYGQYSHLQFNNGKISHKQTANSVNGIKLYERIPTRALQVKQFHSLDHIIANLGDRKIVVIGEQHDRFEHHQNQLQLIRKLKQAGHKVAVGMEMFQQPYQQALDDYVAGKIDESAFLTQSRYFKKWAYDYNLYKPIIDYAVKHQIPLLALNIEADITHHVARKGLYSLDEEQQRQIPDTMDFDNSRYRETLRSVFQMHDMMQKDREMDFNHFLQSQILWDESMANKASQFIKNNPDFTLVILAGNGHLRYRHGVPQRLKRLTAQEPVVIVQDDELGADIADYILLTTPLEGKPTPLLGVMVDTDNKDKVVVQNVVPDSLAGKADIKKGDVLVEIDNKPLKTFSDLKLALLYANQSGKMLLKVQRADDVLVKTLDLTADIKQHSPHFKHSRIK